MKRIIALLCIMSLGPLCAADNQKYVSMPELPDVESDVDEFDMDYYTLLETHSYPSLPVLKHKSLNLHPTRLELPADFNEHGASIYSPYAHIKASAEHANIELEKRDKELILKQLHTPSIRGCFTPCNTPTLPLDRRDYWEKRELIRLQKEGKKKLAEQEEERMVRSEALRRRHYHNQ